LRLRAVQVSKSRAVPGKSNSECARLAKIDKEVSTHTFRHSFGTQLIQKGYDTQHLRFWAGVCTIQALLGHKDVRTTMIYTHVLQRGADWQLLAPRSVAKWGQKPSGFLDNLIFIRARRKNRLSFLLLQYNFPHNRRIDL
jgi:hypothetical protein